MAIKTKVGLIVAHPDDETLWAGGTILMHPEWNCFIYSLCRANDPERSVNFFKAMDYMQASGKMANLDDGPEQLPLEDSEVRSEIIGLVGNEQFDILITHGLNGEYTRHLRHEETAKAVTGLWVEKKILSHQLWLFAYEDDEGNYLPRANEKADSIVGLPEKIWFKKHSIITDIYGFEPHSWEAKTTPKKEAFWQFSSISDFLNIKENESISII